VKKDVAPPPPPPPAPAAKVEAPAAEKPVEKADDTVKAPAGASALRIVFKPTETAVPLSAKEDISKLVNTLTTNSSDRVTLIAYASNMGEQASTSRRVSLSRALSVRASLIDQGISPLRINVLAEGDKNPSGEPDRVDIFIRKSTDPK
jgi:outer membrane protein OmpA-like peptidoglycan-associated protein